MPITCELLLIALTPNSPNSILRLARTAQIERDKCLEHPDNAEKSTTPGGRLIKSTMLAYGDRLRIWRLFCLSLLAAFSSLVPTAVFAQKNADCLACHSDISLTKKDGKSVYVNEYLLKTRPPGHRKLQCVDCHIGIDMNKTPHASKIRPVVCVDCHLDVAKRHTTHKDCVPTSGAPEEMSAECKKCHGSHMHAPDPSACGECHPDELSQYQQSIHGKAFARGVQSAPVCINCHHGYHATSPKLAASPVHPRHVAGTCSRCHESKPLAAKFDIPTRRLETYRRSYHGIANEFGDRTVANCASCHGAHDILPSSDPRSSVNPKNLPKTCGKCHPGANSNFAKGKIHVVISKQEQPALFYVSGGFKWLTICTMLALVGHIGLDLFGRFRRRAFRR